MLKVKKKYQSEIIFFVLMMLVCFTFFCCGKQKIFAATDGQVNLEAWSLTDFKDSEGETITEVTVTVGGETITALREEDTLKVAEATLVYDKSVESDLTDLVIPNAADFLGEYPNLEKVWISKDTMRDVASNANKEDGTLSISDTKFIDEVTEEESNAFVFALGEDWSETFADLDKITAIDLTGLDTSGVTDMHGMFKGCSSLSILNVSSLDTSSVTDLSHIFDGCEALTTFYLGDFDLSSATNLSYMFSQCRSLVSLDSSNFYNGDQGSTNNFDTSSAEDMSYMFAGCISLTRLDISDFDTGKVTTFSHMFDGCGALVTLDLSSFDTETATDLSYMFAGCETLVTLDLSSFDTSDVITMEAMFAGCMRLTTLDISDFDTEEVTTFSHMFDGCMALVTLDLSSFDTETATDLSYMFAGCMSLTTLDISSDFDTGKVTTFSHMFEGCTALVTLDLSSFDTETATDLSYMFAECETLVTLDLSSFDTSDVITMEAMFSGCKSLTTLDLSSFDTSDVTSMAEMFWGCRSLTTLDLSSFDISEVEDFEDMFYDCYALAYLMLSQDILESLYDDETALEWMLYDLFALEDEEEPKFLFITSDDKKLFDLTDAFDSIEGQMVFVATLKVDGKTVKFADNDNKTEKYIALFTNYAIGDIPEQILKDFVDLLETERSHLIIAPGYEIGSWEAQQKITEEVRSVLQNVYTMKATKTVNPEVTPEEGDKKHDTIDDNKNNEREQSYYPESGYSGYSWSTVENSGGGSSGSSSSSPNQDLIFENQTTNNETSRQTELKIPEKLRTRKYLIGYDDGKIKPENHVTHAEFATIIYRLMNDGEEVNLNNLERIEDVKGTDWFGKAVAYLIDDSRKIINITEKKFRPQENIKGYEMMNIIHSVLKFYGVEQNSLYAQNLNSDITRAKMAEIIFNLLDRKSNQSQKIYSDLDKNHLEYKFLMDAAE